MSATQTLVPEALFDSHVHLDFPQFDADREQVLARARALGLSGFVLPAVRARDWPRLRAAAAEPDLHACYGLHPCFCDDHQTGDLEALKLWTETEKTVAVGECGLDFYEHFRDTEAQQRFYLEGQLWIASEHKLPVVLHARRAVDAVLKCLRMAQQHDGVMHSFSGSLQQAKSAIDLGLYIGVGGSITHERARKLRAVVAQLPLHAIVLETDAPDQPGAQHKGQRNEPGFLVSVLDTLAQLRSETRDEIARVTTQNARVLFSLD